MGYREKKLRSLTHKPVGKKAPRKWRVKESKHLTAQRAERGFKP